MDLFSVVCPDSFELLADILDSVDIVSGVADDIRIAVHFLPASHQSGEFAYIGKALEIVLG